MHKAIKCVQFVLALVGGWFIFEMLVNLIMFAFSYVTNAGRWLMIQSLAQSQQEACDAEDLAEELCQNNLAVGWTEYWQKNPIGVNWDYILGALPIALLGVVLLVLARYIGRFGKTAPTAEIVSPNGILPVGAAREEKPAPSAPQKMTAGAQAALFMMCCGLFLLLGAGYIYGIVLHNVRGQAGQMMSSFYAASELPMGVPREHRGEIRELQEEIETLVSDMQEASANNDREGVRESRERLDEIHERVRELEGSREDWTDEIAAMAVVEEEAQQHMGEFHEKMDRHAKLGAILGNIGFLMFVPGLLLFLFLRRRAQTSVTASV